MKIIEVQTVRAEEYAEYLGLLLKTDDGLTGLGETCFGPESVEAYMHESVAPRLLGSDPLTIERHAKELPSFYVTHGGTGVSTRAHSAVDIALWDLFGKVCGQPLYQLLGGKVRDRSHDLQHLRRLSLRPSRGPLPGDEPPPTQTRPWPRRWRKGRTRIWMPSFTGPTSWPWTCWAKGSRP